MHACTWMYRKVYIFIHLQHLLIHLQMGEHEIYTSPIEQSDWSEFTTMVQVWHTYYVRCFIRINVETGVQSRR